MPPRQTREEAGFSLGDLARVVRRRILWFVAPAVLGMTIALGVALGLPAVYQAETTILIEAQGIPERLVPTSVVQDKETRFHNISMLILARDNLAAVIGELKLYPEIDAAMETKVERMRQDITIEPILPKIVDPRRPIEINSLRVAYRGEDPKMIADVANRLARDFIRENIEARAADAEGTTEFLQSELDRENQELNRIAHEIAKFKEDHDGELPDQLAFNRQKLDRMSQERAIKMGELETARSQTGLIRAQLHELRIVGANKEDNPGRRLAVLEGTLTSMTSRGFTEKHPDVVKTRAEIEEVRSQLQAAASSPQQNSPQAYSPEETRLIAELRNYEVAIQVLSEDVERLAEEISRHESRIEATTQIAAQLAHMENTYNSITQAIRDLQAKKTNAEISRAMEAKQKGEKFRVVESAVPPNSPVEPNRPLLFAVGAILGLMSGIALMVVRELTDRRFYSLAELQQSLRLPVLGTVAVIRLASEVAETRARQRRWGISTAVAVLVLTGVGVGAYFYLAAPEGPAPVTTAPGEPAEGGGDV